MLNVLEENTTWDHTFQRLESKLPPPTNAHQSILCRSHWRLIFSLPSLCFLTNLARMVTLAQKKARLSSQMNRNVLFPLNSSRYAGRSQEAWFNAKIHIIIESQGKTWAKPHKRVPRSSCLAEIHTDGSTRGSRDRYHRKYCAVTTLKNIAG